MSPQVNIINPPVAPQPRPGPKPCSPHACKGRADAIARPLARPSVPVSPPPRHPIDGTPETLAAALALGGLAVGADVTAAGAATALRSASSYLSRLAGGIVHGVSDPMRTGEHIAEGVVGGAAWAGAAAGVSALADAARGHVVPARSAPH
jgi:hypothetical protein